MYQDRATQFIKLKTAKHQQPVVLISIIAALVILVSYSIPASADGDLSYQKAKTSFEAGNVGSAVLWLEKAVSQGNMPAHLPLAAMYRDGHGVELDYVNFVPVPGHRGALPLSMKGTSNGTTTQNVHG